MNVYWSYLNDLAVPHSVVVDHLSNRLDGFVTLVDGFTFEFEGDEFAAGVHLRRVIAEVVPAQYDDEGCAVCSGSWFTPVDVSKNHRWMSDQLKSRFENAIR